jgi:hypothetical protein
MKRRIESYGYIYPHRAAAIEVRRYQIHVRCVSEPEQPAVGAREGNNGPRRPMRRRSTEGR